MKEISKVNVTIFGNTFNIQGDAPPEYIDGLARYVDNKMEEVSANMKSPNLLQIAVLAALNIADEYHQLKRIDTTNSDDITKRASALISMLEEGLIGDILDKPKG
ncbi:MAG: cell division protein ZapA [Spirochaetes bacterium]|jgi:cell division protein ZapA|nr:cell division protein ZapA [Spirochaetota bacterium]